MRWNVIQFLNKNHVESFTSKLLSKPGGEVKKNHLSQIRISHPKKQTWNQEIVFTERAVNGTRIYPQKRVCLWLKWTISSKTYLIPTTFKHNVIITLKKTPVGHSRRSNCKGCNRQDEVDDMVQCDKCETWWHFSCANRAIVA